MKGPRAIMFALLVSACSSAGNAKPDAGAHSAKSDAGAHSLKADAGDAAQSAASKRPAGPAADVSEEITGANAPFIGAGSGLAVPDGYVEHEYVASGTATAYAAKGALSMDGRWTFEPDTTAAYRTRVLVRRPASMADASGTVIVEWLNVSGGIDANPEYASFEEEIVRQGHVWVGVSAQLIGVAGGPVLVKAPGADNIVGKGLMTIDPERYGSLDHPGDGYSFDIFTQVARALWKGGLALGGAQPKLMLAAGESQSAIALTTYYDGVQPLTLVFDGFLVHSRASGSLPLVDPGKYADLAGSITSSASALLRDDLDAPVVELQAESDVTGILNSVVVRQPDGDRFRLWEVAGTSHADAHLLGSTADMIDCGAPINDGPMHLVAKAALHGLETWVRAGDPPLIAPRLQVTDAATPAIVRNDDGIALGGIRTPPVDVPVEALSGAPGSNPDLLCILLGSAKPLAADRLAQLYPSRAAYQKQYDDATDQTIQSGFVLAPDRDALLAFAQPSRINP
ncbi:MAG: alpha/beta hydrolase domain-containing protein [Polyangiales bacterium]